jgi:hypothetical protein
MREVLGTTTSLLMVPLFFVLIFPRFLSHFPITPFSLLTIHIYYFTAKVAVQLAMSSVENASNVEIKR